MLESLALLKIAWPLAIAYLGEMAMFVIDVIIISRLGPTELAGVGLSSTLAFEGSVLAVATLSIVGVLVSQANGRGDNVAIAHRLRQGLLVALLMSIPVILFLTNLEPVLVLFGQDPEVIKISNRYLFYASWSFIPGLCFLVMKDFLAALSKTIPVMVITIVAIALKAALSYVLVFGVGPFPDLDVAGAGLATTIVSSFMFVIICLYCYFQKEFRALALYTGSWSIDWGLWKRIFRLGLPIGFIAVFEAGLFAFVALSMGAIDPNALAANQIVFNFVGMAFMVTMALGDSAAIRVAFHLAREDPLSARRAGVLSLIMATINMGLAAAIYMTWGSAIPALLLDTSSPDSQPVIAYAAAFFFIAAFFQLGDGLQAVASRALRGMEDTTVPLCIAAFGYWAVGALSGYVLAFHLDYGAEGIWVGLAFGLTVTAVLMVSRFLILSKRLVP
ncbi:MATE family efflux transporter [Alphaproteobacteria bacterium]|nr:MATE family efflux transporter [Alphaproteobacteria bacterium]